MSTGITFGKVVAGAAMATGAVLLVAAVMPDTAMQDLLTGLGKIGKVIGGFFTSAPTPSAPDVATAAAPPPPGPVAPPNFWQRLVSGDVFAKNPGLTKGLAGAAVLGGGYALSGHMDDLAQQKADNAEITAAEQARASTFADQLEIRRMQGLMKASYAMQGAAAPAGPAIG